MPGSMSRPEPLSGAEGSLDMDPGMRNKAAKAGSVNVSLPRPSLILRMLLFPGWNVRLSTNFMKTKESSASRMVERFAELLTSKKCQRWDIPSESG